MLIGAWNALTELGSHEDAREMEGPHRRESGGGGQPKLLRWARRLSRE